MKMLSRRELLIASGMGLAAISVGGVITLLRDKQLASSDAALIRRLINTSVIQPIGTESVTQQMIASASPEDEVLSGGVSLQFWQKILSYCGGVPISIVPFWDTSTRVAQDISGKGNHGEYKNAILNQPGVNIHPCVKLNGNGMVNMYSTGFSRGWIGNELTLNVFFKPLSADFWTNRKTERICIFRGKTLRDDIQIHKSDNNTITATTFFGGVFWSQVLSDSLNTTGWSSFGMTRSLKNDRGRVYFNGNQVGSDKTGLGSWKNTLLPDRCVFGAENTAIANPLSGYLAYGVIAAREFSPEQMKQLTYPNLTGNPIWYQDVYSGLFPEKQYGDFTIIAIPDTQMYASTYPQIGMTVAEYVRILAEIDPDVMILHEGDLVDSGSDLSQWANAKAQWDQLIGLPALFAVGNHDYPERAFRQAQAETVNRTLTNYFATISPDRFSGFSCEYFSPGKTDNMYMIQRYGSVDYLFLNIEFAPRTAVLKWADDVISNNADVEVIVLTHSYIHETNKLTQEGSEIWRVLKKYQNVKAVICGHVGKTDFEGYLAQTGDNGNTVHAIECDPQAAINGGNGYIRLMRYSPMRGKLIIKTYSPFTSLFKTNPDNQFEVDI